MIPEAKIQSTGQAGPQVNRDLEVLFERLNLTIRELNSLSDTVLALTGGSKGSPVSPVTDPGGGGGTTIQQTFPVYEASGTVLAGTGESVSTENAWTTVVSGAPSGSRFAIIQFRMWSANDDAGGALLFRKESGAQEITAAVVRADGTSDSDRDSYPIVFVELTASGGFDYRANETAGDVGWSVRRLGYW